MIYRLDPDVIGFPDPRMGDHDGLFAVGGDLKIKRLLLGYHHGIFPWYAFRKEDNHFRDENGEPWIQWWCPMQRFVIFPDEIHVSHSMRSLIRKQRYTFSFNKAFPSVIHHCGALRDAQPGAWLGPHIEKVYTELNELGWATSVEVWEEPSADTTSADASVSDSNDTSTRDPQFTYDSEGRRLVGGLYGITVGKTFIGESMFSLVPSGSKLALIYLASYMRERGLKMIDCQLHTPHLESMGGRYISYDEYMDILNSGLK